MRRTESGPVQSSGCLITILVVLAALTATPVACAPLGLNLIPTADVLDAGDISLETEAVGNDLLDGETEHAALMQLGIGKGLELGVDPVFDGGGTVLNVKWRILEESDRTPEVAVGVQTIASGATSEPYVVGFTSYGDTRLHLGGALIGGDAQLLLGIDRQLDDRWTLQADFASGDENSLSVGAAVAAGESYTLTGAYLIPNGCSGEHGLLLNLAWVGKFW